MLIRQAQVAREGGWLVLRAQVSYQGKDAECFYSVPERFADFADTASSNCFLVGLLYPAMRAGEDVHVEGTVSARLLFNINEFLVPFMSMCDFCARKARRAAIPRELPFVTRELSPVPYFW